MENVRGKRVDGQLRGHRPSLKGAILVAISMLVGVTLLVDDRVVQSAPLLRRLSTAETIEEESVTSSPPTNTMSSSPTNTMSSPPPKDI